MAWSSAIAFPFRINGDMDSNDKGIHLTFSLKKIFLGKYYEEKNWDRTRFSLNQESTATFTSSRG
ncbi:Hypothetical protein LEPBI_p0035 (plasmid) [Leptospira biflexa serovar Patoc strain 'Patoc 1 (Paris)']|uniref:Uncharacterized protein n=1 Tax=Leptospira biflexa serovar Patoc (strain Patoc 1 / ATCC 23582 / Paris) TaxID=456481 RepID=B0SUG4_LEPBP|nr:Hypothetical protein LEPBI_p0035 [Leptospira biflexa serovar Patoc strain 'Patoc 1 (Paris)']